MSKIVLGQTLKSLMKETGISVRALAREVGIPQSTLNQLVQGREPSKIEHLLKLANHFDVSLDFLLQGHERKSKRLNNLKGTELFSGICRIRIEKIIDDEAESD